MGEQMSASRTTEVTQPDGKVSREITPGAVINFEKAKAVLNASLGKKRTSVFLGSPLTDEKLVRLLAESYCFSKLGRKTC